MSRFYNTARVNTFIDFAHTLPEQELKEAVLSQSKFTEEAKTEAESLGNTILDMQPAELFKEDFQNITKPIVEEIDAITAEIQKDPINYRSSLPKLDKLKADLQRNLSTGQLAAIKEGTQRFNEQEAILKDTFKNLPKEYNYIRDNYVENLKNSLQYDAGLNSYGELAAAEFVKPVTQKEEEDLIKNFVDNINTKQLAGRIKDANGNPVMFTLEHLNNIDSLLRTGQLKGVTKQELEKAFRAYVPDEFLQSYQQRANATNLPIDELDRTSSSNQLSRLAAKVGLSGGLELEEDFKPIRNNEALTNMNNDARREINNDNIASRERIASRNNATRERIAQLQAQTARMKKSKSETAASDRKYNNTRWNNLLNSPSKSTYTPEEIEQEADKANVDTWQWHEKNYQKELKRVESLNDPASFDNAKKVVEPFTLTDPNGLPLNRKIFFDYDKGRVQIHTYTNAKRDENGNYTSLGGQPEIQSYSKDSPVIRDLLKKLRLQGMITDRFKVDYNKIKGEE